MIGEQYADISLINNELAAARKKLPYIYFHNFVGSDWVNTICPSCGSIVIERFSLGCGGDKLKTDHTNEGCCNSCGREIHLLSKNLK
jgi:predicted RNA-binding Zn-ribbon protein involved in translation (DUF1610 family)